MELLPTIFAGTFSAIIIGFFVGLIIYMVVGED